MTAPDAVRRKALAVLREGRVTLLVVRSDPDTLAVTKVVARVQGSRGTYVVDYRVTADSGWDCTCSRGMAGQRCGHILAAQLVTGHSDTAAVRAA